MQDKISVGGGGMNYEGRVRGKGEGRGGKGRGGEGKGGEGRGRERE